ARFCEEDTPGGHRHVPHGRRGSGAPTRTPARDGPPAWLRFCCEGQSQPARYPARNTHSQSALANRVRVKSFPYPSPFRERLDMRFPQVSERVKEAPANALRSVFASIGQVLLVTDRMKKKSGETDETAPESAVPAGEAGAAEDTGASGGTAASAAAET